MERIKTVFMGSDAIALPVLEDLAAHFADRIELCAVWTQPDRRHGRGMKLVANEIKQWAEGQGVPVRQPVKIAPEDVETLEAAGVELILVMAYGHILKRALIGIPRLGTLNLHASILPQYRGASPIEAAIASGDTETGVSLMRIVPALDAGPVCDIERVPVTDTDTRITVGEKLAQACVPLMRRALPRVIDGKAAFTPQEDAAATFCGKLTKDDAILDFSSPAKLLHDRIRALQPWPGAVAGYGDTRLKIGEARNDTASTPDLPPGTIISAGSDAVAVATGQGVLRLTRLQRPGAKMLPVADFLCGFPLEPGSKLEGGPMRPLVSE